MSLGGGVVMSRARKARGRPAMARGGLQRARRFYALGGGRVGDAADAAAPAVHARGT